MFPLVDASLALQPAPGHSLTPGSPCSICHSQAPARLHFPAAFVPKWNQSHKTQSCGIRPQAVCLRLSDSDSSGRRSAEQPLNSSHSWGSRNISRHCHSPAASKPPSNLQSGVGHQTSSSTLPSLALFEVVSSACLWLDINSLHQGLGTHGCTWPNQESQLRYSMLPPPQVHLVLDILWCGYQKTYVPALKQKAKNVICCCFLCKSSLMIFGFLKKHCWNCDGGCTSIFVVRSSWRAIFVYSEPLNCVGNRVREEACCGWRYKRFRSKKSWIVGSCESQLVCVAASVPHAQFFIYKIKMLMSKEHSMVGRA